MKKILLISLVMLFACKHQAVVPQEEHPMPVQVSSKQFDQLKTLAGTWEGAHRTAKGNEPAKVEYQITSGGSAIVEKLFPGTPHEMVSIYTPTKTQNGSTVLMTHYCMLGNQPRMELTKADAKSMHFSFVEGTNITSDKDMHMHALKITFKDQNNFTQEWTSFKDGKAMKPEVFTYSRIGNN